MMNCRNLQSLPLGLFLSGMLYLSLPAVNAAVVAVTDDLERVPDTGAKVPVSFLLENDLGDPIVFEGVAPSTSEGGTVTTSAGWVFYNPPPPPNENPATDIIGYYISDGQGSPVVGIVRVTLRSDPMPPELSLVEFEPDSYRIAFQGVAWWTYTVEYKSALDAPVWSVLGAGVAGANGEFLYDDILPGDDARFYRVVDQGNASSSVYQVAVSSSANPALPGAPVTFSAAVTPILPGGDPAAGFVQFNVEGEDFGAPAIIEDGVASITDSALPAGLLTVTARYTDPDTDEVTLGLLYPSQLINTPPLVVEDSLLQGFRGTKVSAKQLLSNDSDADGDVLTLHDVDRSGTNGGTVVLSGGWIYYKPPPGAHTNILLQTDAFGYQVADGLGAPVEGTVVVSIPPATAASANLTVFDLGGGTNRLIFNGIPWRRYTIERANDYGASPWMFLSMQNANAFGSFIYDDDTTGLGSIPAYRVLDELAEPVASPFRQAAWEAFIANTNGRTIDMWLQREQPDPEQPPFLRWNPDCLLYGLEGFTGISQWNEWQSAPGQSAVTLLTPRHGYLRGHGSGPEGFHTNRLTGDKVWFATANDEVVEMTVAASLVRYSSYNEVFYDHTIVIFSNDVPASVTPLSVMGAADFETYYYDTQDLPFLVYLTEQHGHCVAGNEMTEIPEFWYYWPVDPKRGAYKGGDSGSPNMIPTADGKLVFYRGTGTSPPSAQTQADMDLLSEYMGLNTNDYQLRWYQPEPSAP